MKINENHTTLGKFHAPVSNNGLVPKNYTAFRGHLQAYITCTSVNVTQISCQDCKEAQELKKACFGCAFFSMISKQVCKGILIQHDNATNILRLYYINILLY